MPFKGVKCPRCRRIHDVEWGRVDTLTITISGPTLKADKVSDEVENALGSLTRIE
ncbi:hypothetical protein LCGC14_0975730 [marine sediment metagenome]|uniref:Uncharacterized protein n=1 Tax=marine sediment metagenome TaxID=412755 RepID=A0A0F9NET8_9ZZZZ